MKSILFFKIFEQFTLAAKFKVRKRTIESERIIRIIFGSQTRRVERPRVFHIRTAAGGQFWTRNLTAVSNRIVIWLEQVTDVCSQILYRSCTHLAFATITYLLFECSFCSCRFGSRQHLWSLLVVSCSNDFWRSSFITWLRWHCWQTLYSSIIRLFTSKFIFQRLFWWTSFSRMAVAAASTGCSTSSWRLSSRHNC